MNFNGPHVVRGLPVLHAWLSSYRVVICVRTDRRTRRFEPAFGRDANAIKNFTKSTDCITTDSH